MFTTAQIVVDQNDLGIKHPNSFGPTPVTDAIFWVSDQFAKYIVDMTREVRSQIDSDLNL